MEDIVEKALNSLPITCIKSALRVSDEDRIKVTFRVLHKKGFELNSAEIEDWLLLHGWNSKVAQQIAKWAESIDSGGQVRLKFKNMAPSEKSVWSRLKV